MIRTRAEFKLRKRAVTVGEGMAVECE